MVTIFPENGILRAETMRFADELRQPKDVDLPARKRLPAAKVKKFEQIISKKSNKRISLDELRDKKTEQLLKLVEKKRSQHKDVVEVEEEKREDGKVVDIMEVLKKSLAGKRQAA
jgi:DNA end-binding protein Ku